MFIMALMLIILIMLLMITIEGIKRTLTVSVEAMLSVMWLSSEVWVQLGIENRLALIQLVIYLESESECIYMYIYTWCSYLESENEYIRGGDDLLALIQLVILFRK